MKPIPNIIFAGTPEFASYHLKILIKNDMIPSLVLTQPDRQSGRGRKITPSSVKKLAISHNIPLFQPNKIDSQSRDFLLSKERPDLLIVVAYGLIIPKWLLDWPKYGAINVHASLLPRWRGAAPIQRAILSGDEKSGVCIMQMDEHLDTGSVWSRKEVHIDEQMTSQDLHDILQNIGAKALIDTIPMILANKNKPTPQSDSGITYAKKISKAEAQINWSDSAHEIARNIKGYNPVPVAFTKDDGNRVFKIFAANIIDKNSTSLPGEIIEITHDQIIVQCKENAIAITDIQETGKKRMSVRDYLNGRSFKSSKFINPSHTT